MCFKELRKHLTNNIGKCVQQMVTKIIGLIKNIYIYKLNILHKKLFFFSERQRHYYKKIFHDNNIKKYMIYFFLVAYFNVKSKFYYSQYPVQSTILKLDLFSIVFI